MPCLPHLLLLLLLPLAGCRAGGPPPETAAHAAEAGFQARRALLLEQVAERYQPTDYADRGKYTFPVVVARHERHGLEDARAAGYIGEYAAGRYGFFHFPFVGLARILGGYADAPAVAASREQFLRAILLHDPSDHYNALTGEGTENHVAMSRTSGYLFAGQALEIPELRATAEAWRRELRAWILAWSRRLFHYGTGEWDSTVYTAYNLIGWLNLHDFTDDPEVRAAARAVLDYHAAQIALKLTQGLYGGPESRGSTRIGPLPRSATEYVAWLWFGDDDPRLPAGFFTSSEYIQAVHAATSSYRPPAQLRALARKEIPRPATYHLAKPDYLMTRFGESREQFHIGKSFTLGTVQTPYGGWGSGCYGQINWKLVIENPEGPPAVLWGNGGMRSTEHPRGRNPFDQFLQHGPVVVQMTRVPANAEAMAAEIADLLAGWRCDHARDFQARWGRPHHDAPGPVGVVPPGSLADAGLSLLYFPADAEVVTAGDWVFIAAASARVAVRSLGRPLPRVGRGRLVDEAGRDAVAGFVVEAAAAAEWDSFAAFQAAVRSVERLRRDPQDVLKFHYTTLAGTELSFRFADAGSWSEPVYDFGYGVTERRVGFNSPEWRQPEWPSGHGHGRIAELWVDGRRDDPWARTAQAEGPLLHHENGVLTLRGPDGSRHTVNPWNAAAPELK